MIREMQMMADFDVADVVPIAALTTEQTTSSLDFTWVHRWKCVDMRSRLCVRGFKQWIKDQDDRLAATPVRLILRLLLAYSLSMQRRIFTVAITTAFLHAIL